MAKVSKGVPPVRGTLVRLTCAGLVAVAASLTPVPAEADEAPDRVQADLERLSAERSVQLADKATGPAARALYEAGAKAYLELFHGRCEAPVDAGDPPRAPRCDEIAFNAARAFRAAGLAPLSIDVYQRLVSYDGKTRGRSPLAKRAIYQLGGVYQALAMYALAAEHYERYATLYPAEPEAAGALADALVLRIGLGEDESASADARLFLKLYSASKPARAAQALLAVAAQYASRGDWARTLATLSGVRSLFDRAPIDIRIQARALLGRAHAGGPLATRALASAEYASVLSLWGDGTQAARAIEAAWSDEDEATRMKRLARALMVVGEAMFFAAEARRLAELEPLKPPVYQGPVEEALMRRHLETRVKDWMQKKRQAIESVEAAYTRVLGVQPLPPPRWAVDSAAQVGAMWATFADEVGRVLPLSVQRRGGRPTQVGLALEGVQDPLRKGRARAALKACLGLSIKFLFVDEHTRACESWLVKNGDIHATDEIIPSLRAGSHDVFPPLVAVDP